MVYELALRLASFEEFRYDAHPVRAITDVLVQYQPFTIPCREFWLGVDVIFNSYSCVSAYACFPFYLFFMLTILIIILEGRWGPSPLLLYETLPCVGKH